MAPLLICNPRNLITFERHEDGARSTLKVNNPTSHHIAMKMKTNSADRYNVKPHFCLLAPNSTRVISISVLRNHLQSVVDEARASSTEGEKKKIVFILFEWLVPSEVLSQVLETSKEDGEVSSSLKSIWADYEKNPVTSGAFLKHRFPIAVVDAVPVNVTESGGSDARMSASLSSNKGGSDDTGNESFFSTGAAPTTDSKLLPPSDRYSSAYDSSTDTGYDTAAAQPWANPSGPTTRPRLPPQGPQGDTVNNYDNSSSNSSAEAGTIYRLPASSSTLPANAGPVMSVEEAKAKRADYNRILNQTLLLQSEMQGLEHALVSRDKEADDLRNTINELRQQLILANSASNLAESSDGLRQRRKEPSAQTSTAFSNEPPEPDDNTVKGGIDEGGGCPLYIVFVVGLIMFVIGFLIPRSTSTV